jgi:hypothetical protein
VNQVSGAPGYAAAIRVRSINTWKSTGNDPLYVIDSIILDKRSFDMLDYSEIEKHCLASSRPGCRCPKLRKHSGAVPFTEANWK